MRKIPILIIVYTLVLAVLFTSVVPGITPQYQITDDTVEVSHKYIWDQQPLLRLTWSGNWTPFGLEGKQIKSLAVTEHYLYAGTYGDGVYRKDLIIPDSLWEYLGFDDEDVKSIYVDPAFPSIIYVGLYCAGEMIDDSGEPHSLYKSYDSGETWDPCDPGIECVDNYGRYRHSILCINGISGNALTLYATTCMNQIFKSINGGQSWNLIYGSLQPVPGPVNVISIDPSDPQRLWVGGESSCFQGFIMKSTDAGQSWIGVTPDMGNIENSCYSIVIDPRDSNIVYAGMEGILAKTTDGGENWTFVLSPLDYPYFYGLVLDLLAPDRIFAGSAPQAVSPLKVWGSGDGGQSWHSSIVEIENGGARVFSLVLDLADHNILYAGTWGGGVWKCQSTWTWRPPDARRCIYD